MGGGAESERVSQGMIAGYKCSPFQTDIASTVQARDYKGVSNQGMTVVYEENQSEERNE